MVVVVIGTNGFHRLAPLLEGGHRGHDFAQCCSACFYWEVNAIDFNKAYSQVSGKCASRLHTLRLTLEPYLPP